MYGAGGSRNARGMGLPAEWEQLVVQNTRFGWRVEHGCTGPA
jgi:hypothetical protein